jgi:hypothetical protein
MQKILYYKNTMLSELSLVLGHRRAGEFKTALIGVLDPRV